MQQRMPGLQWLKREMLTLNGVRWVHLEMTTRAIDTTIYNDIYFTSFAGKMLGFNFNATTAMKNQALPQLRKSRDSIRIKP